MKINYIKGDLFTTECEYLVHCISADYSLGAGIAKDFAERYDVRKLLYKERPLRSVGDCIPITSKGKTILNLITKNFSCMFPTYENLAESLHSLREYCEEVGVRHLAMPKISCGLDKMSWKKVSSYIEIIFGDMHITIDVYVK